MSGMFACVTVKNKHAIKLYIAVGIGGMIGAICRYGISNLFEGSYHSFPYATFTVNLFGCFLLSFLTNHANIKRKLSPEVFTAVGTGIIGAFTTFSTFAVETIKLSDAQPFMAFAYVLLSILGGLVFCYGGYQLAGRKRDVQ